MPDNSADNRRIARNTVLLYLRTLLVMAISLYTSRIVLVALGVVDFGIYNVVASVVSLFAVLNNSMATSTQRYLTYSIGEGNCEKTKIVFGNAIRIHFLIGIIVVLLCETAGIWLVNAKLVIPGDRITAANWIFQLSLFSFFISVTQVPYYAAIIAHEKMGVYAYVSIIDALLRLAAVFVLKLIPYDKLIVYAVLIFIITQIVRTIYYCYCRRAFPECRGKSLKNNSFFKEMFHFAGWNLFGSLAWMLKDQGANIILNLFFGPIVNAARGLAMQVSNAITSFVNNFTTALNPQITKNYAQGRIDDMETLAYRGSRFSFYLLLIIVVPFVVNIDFVLNLWLPSVPENTALFTTLILADQLVNCICGTTMITSLMATGKIKRYQIIVSLFILLVVPVGYAVFKMGAPAHSIFIVMICCTFISGVARYCFCVKQIGYNTHRFITDVVFRVGATLALSLPVPFAIKHLRIINNPLLEFIVLCFTSLMSIGTATLFVGMSAEERKTIIKTVLLKLKHRR